MFCSHQTTIIIDTPQVLRYKVNLENRYQIYVGCSLFTELNSLEMLEAGGVVYLFGFIVHTNCVGGCHMTSKTVI